MRMIAGAIGLVVLATLFGGGSGPARAADAPLVVKVGDGEHGYAVNAFLPATLTVATGDTVRWAFPWYEPHSITFGFPDVGAPQSTPSPATFSGQPYLSSDLTFGPDKSYDIRFTRAGDYDFHCIYHPNMGGHIKVLAAGGVGDSQAALDGRAATQYRSELTEIKRIAAEWNARPPEVNTLPDGSREFVSIIAGETKDGVAQLFFPPNLSVSAGDTIRWHSVISFPHTVTFGPFPPGAPLLGNPAIEAVARPGESYEGTGYWNSGILGIDWSGGLDFAMRFTKPGRYPYYCVLHASQGMVGIVAVNANTTPTPGTTPSLRPPSTGRVRGSDSEAGWALALAALLSVPLAAALAGRLRRR